MSEWQPIDTAPKDGTQFDLWTVGPSGGPGNRIPNAKYAKGMNGEWELWGMHNKVSPYLTPTHWQPLPKGPL